MTAQWSSLVERLRGQLPESVTEAELAAFLVAHRDGSLFEQIAATRRFPHLLTLSLGLGRDSLTMLCLLQEGRLLMEGQVLKPDDLDGVVFSDTGAEWPFTYALLARARSFTEAMGVRFFHLQKPPRSGSRGWLSNPRSKGDRSEPAWMANTESWSLVEKAAGGVYHRRLPIREEFMRFSKLAVTVNSSCTDNHKIQPIRRWLRDLCIESFGLSTRAWGALVRQGLRQRHRALIGIAADEASRAINTGHPSYEWAVYPLIELGITKADEAGILQRHGWDVPEGQPVYKSGCTLCPYQPVSWFWVLQERHPELFAQIEAYEAAALAINPKMYIARGRPIREVVLRWRERNPHATHESVLRKSYTRCNEVGA